MVYKTDFEMEREDRARAQTQRAEEGEQYEKEIESLKAKLQKLTADNKDGQRKSYELQQACQDELMKEIQTKTAQVKQYRKQNDLVSAQVLVYMYLTCIDT